MSEMGKVAARSTRNSIILFSGTLSSEVINAIGAVAVARLVPADDYGILALSYVIPGFLLLFTDWGINSALTRFLARYQAEGRYADVRRAMRNGLLFKISVSLIFTLVIYLIPEFLAWLFLKRPELAYIVRFTSVFVILNTLNQTCNAILVGIERMEIISATMLIQSVVKVSASILLVLYGHGFMGAVEGFLLSMLVVLVISLLFIFKYMKQIGPDSDVVSTETGLSTMLRFGAPLFLGGFIVGIGNRYQNFLLAWVADNVTIGNYDVANKFVSLLTMITAPISQTLYPTFSRFSVEDRLEILREIFKASVRYSTLVIFPSMALFILLSRQMIEFLFGSNYAEAPLFFSLLTLQFISVGVGNLSTISFLNSQGDTRTTLQINVLNFILTVGLSTFLARSLGVPGLLIGMTLSSIGYNLFGLYKVNVKYRLTVDYIHVIRVAASTLFSTLSGYSVLYFLQDVHLIIQLAIGASVFMISYLVVSPLSGALVHSDLQNLRGLIEKSPIRYPFFDFFIDLWSRLFRTRV